MNGTQEPSASNLDHRIAQLDEGAARMITFHSGTRPDAPVLLLEALEGHYRRFPNIPVIKIYWKPSKNGRKLAMDNVECGICHLSGKFQKIADHIVCEHFNLSLWYCGLNSCRTSVSRKSDLDRHRKDMHNIPRPRKAKADRLSQASSPIGFPPSSPTPSISPRLGPMRRNKSRSRSMEPSASPSYSVGDIFSWPNDNALQVDIQRHSIPSRQEAGSGHATSHTLPFGGGYPNLVLPETTLPTDHVSSLPDESLRVFYPIHSRNSSYGLGIGISSDGTRLFEQTAARKLLPSTPNRQVGPCHAFDGYSPSDFLSPSPRASTSSLGIGLLPLPQPVHRVTTPIQTKSVQPGIYHASNLLERMHLLRPPSPPHNYSIHESSGGPMVSYPMTLSPQYYPPSAQINMPNAVPHWMPALNTPPSRSYTPYPVDEDFAFNVGATDALFGPRQ